MFDFNESHHKCRKPVKMDARGNAAAEHYRIAGTKLFAAGDMHSGQSLVVRAIRQGIECAREADLFLMGYTNLEVQ
jgi:glutamate synthase (NADPH/NADH) small chain